MAIGIGAIGPGISGTSGGGGGSGTVTSVSVVSTNGFAGTVANASTTPAITMKTTITGLLKGNGTAISAATAGTDYAAPLAATAVSSTGNSAGSTFELVTTGSSTITRTLPAPAANLVVGFKKIDSGAGTVVISHHASETIDGASTFTISTQYASIQLISDGTNWFVF